MSDRISANIPRDTATAVNLRSDLDQLLAQVGQQPRLRRFGHRQHPHEIALVVGEGVELKTYGVCGEGAARQACPFDRALSFLGPLLRRAALIVQGDDATPPIASGW
jgi:hypothetical protein